MKKEINKTILAIAVAALTIIIGFWLAYLLYNIVMN